MPICLLCRNPVASLVTVENQITVAARCSQCTRVADKYIEQDTVTLWMDLMLLHGQAWSHCVFNSDRNRLRKTVAIVLLVAFFLDAYVVMVMNELALREEELHMLQGSDGTVTNYTELRGQLLTGIIHAATVKGNNPSLFLSENSPHGVNPSLVEGDENPLMSVVKSNGLPVTQSGVILSLRLVDVARSGILHIGTVMAFAGYAAWEFAIVGLCIVWATSAMGLGLVTTKTAINRQDEKSNTLLMGQTVIRTASRGMSLLAGPKLMYLLFLIWELPLYLLALVEVTSILTTFMCGRALLGPQASITRPFFITVVSVGARVVFRIVTQWAPVTVLMCGPAYLSLLAET